MLSGEWEQYGNTRGDEGRMTPRQFLKALQHLSLAQRMHAWEVAHAGKLTTRQEDALASLLDQLQQLIKQYPGQQYFDEAYEESDQLIRAADRIRLSDHPLVHEWMMTRRLQQFVDTWNEKGLPWSKDPYVVPEIIKALRRVHQGKVSLRQAFRGLKKDG